MKLWKECVSCLVSSLVPPLDKPKAVTVGLAREGASVSIVVALLPCFLHMYLKGTIRLLTLHRWMKGKKLSFFLTNALVPNTAVSRGTISSTKHLALDIVFSRLHCQIPPERRGGQC